MAPETSRRNCLSVCVILHAWFLHDHEFVTAAFVSCCRQCFLQTFLSHAYQVDSCDDEQRRDISVKMLDLIYIYITSCHLNRCWKWTAFIWKSEASSRQDRSPCKTANYYSRSITSIVYILIPVSVLCDIALQFQWIIQQHPRNLKLVCLRLLIAGGERRKRPQAVRGITWLGPKQALNSTDSKWKHKHLLNVKN